MPKLLHECLQKKTFQVKIEGTRSTRRQELEFHKNRFSRLHSWTALTTCQNKVERKEIVQFVYDYNNAKL